jgi:DNA polymerase-3 subunit epsilon
MAFRWPARRVVALDLECTGINAARDRILQYGISGVDADGATPIHLTALVDAETTTGRDPKNIPGVTWEQLRTARPLRDGHLAAIARACAGAVVLIHNRPYDWTLLRNEFARNGAPPLAPHAVVCTLNLTKHRLGLPPPHRLSVLCAAHGVPLELAHNAIHDAAATFRLYVTLASQCWATWPDDRSWWVARSPHWPPEHFPWAGALRSNALAAPALERFRQRSTAQ